MKTPNPLEFSLNLHLKKRLFSNSDSFYNCASWQMRVISRKKSLFLRRDDASYAIRFGSASFIWRVFGFSILERSDTRTAFQRQFYGLRSTVNTKKLDTPVGHHFNHQNHSITGIILFNVWDRPLDQNYAVEDVFLFVSHWRNKNVFRRDVAVTHIVFELIGGNSF